MSTIETFTENSLIGEPIELKSEFPYNYPKPIDWKSAVQKHVPNQIDNNFEDKSRTEKGRTVHKAIEEFFGDVNGLKFENTTRYPTGNNEWGFGTYDAYDGNFVYEFKTKHPDLFKKAEKYDNVLPRGKDLKQINKYLEGTDTDWGILVYINRDDFDVREYPIEKKPLGSYEDIYRASTS